MTCPSCGSSSFEQLDTDIRRCNNCLTLGSNYYFSSSLPAGSHEDTPWEIVQSVCATIAIMGLFMGGVPWLLFLIPIAIVGYPLYWLYLIIVWFIGWLPSQVLALSHEFELFAEWVYPFIFGWWLK